MVLLIRTRAFILEMNHPQNKGNGRKRVLFDLLKLRYEDALI